jgi:hypothetical protein
MAAAGGNLQLLQWLIEGKKCSVKDNATKRQLVTGKNLSVLAVAAQAGHVPIMRYLIHQRKCGVLEITEMSILHRALHVALEVGNFCLFHGYFSDFIRSAVPRSHASLHPAQGHQGGRVAQRGRQRLRQLRTGQH